MRYSLHQLELLAAVAKTGSLAEAIKKSGSEYTLLAELRSLEQELGLPLFLHEYGALALTPVGKLLYPSVDEVLDKFKKFNDTLKGLKAREKPMDGEVVGE